MGASRAQDPALAPESLHSVRSYKRLDRGTFRLPEPGAADARYVEVDDATLDALLDGIEVDASARARPRRPRLQ
jgi:hypothetical protein